MTETPSAHACPICGTPATPDLRPFCSKRCADVDLHRWLGGVYRVETNERSEENASDDVFSSRGA
ncbi:DNA gyrase inhibitor YacG [Magnetospirillum molischianum]|uniref:DNA gyrase inhibitor YacG n=1 Tax=Magnetospirillum molischianum TaxID=1083 RepID=UPI00030C2F2F|nr:DNA gyrase inhibitor YacG [Magnetospirillum molischianum]